MKEHINEEAWTSENILSGTQTMEAAPGAYHRAHVNSMIETWFEHHDDGWNDVMVFCEDAVPTRESGRAMRATVPMATAPPAHVPP